MIERLKQSKDQDDTRTLWLKVEKLVELSQKQVAINNQLLELGKLGRETAKILKEYLTAKANE